MPQLLPYDVDDDEAAARYVSEALRRPQQDTWKALTADDRVVQTYRVLRRIESESDLTHLRRRREIRLAALDRNAGLISDEEFAEKNWVYADWRTRAAVFDGLLRQYLDIVKGRVRTVEWGPVVACLRTTLLTLALAVDEHRTAHSGEESLADTALWARLSTLPWPTDAGAEVRTLADAVAAEWARRGPARVNSEGFIEFEGQRIPGMTVDVADLILEVTDHVNPSIPRPELVALWKQRTPDLLETEAAKVTAKRQVGHYASQRLRKALMFLELLGTIARTTDETPPQVTVTDRAKLCELRRRWDDKYFTRYELGQ